MARMLISFLSGSNISAMMLCPESLSRKHHTFPKRKLLRWMLAIDERCGERSKTHRRRKHWRSRANFFMAAVLGKFKEFAPEPQIKEKVVDFHELVSRAIEAFLNYIFLLLLRKGNSSSLSLFFFLLSPILYFHLEVHLVGSPPHRHRHRHHHRHRLLRFVFLLHHRLRFLREEHLPQPS